MTPEAILERLAPSLAEQGIEVTLTGSEGGVVRIEARRTGPGWPLAFLSRALEGTFKRYLPGFRGLLLEGYVPLEGRTPGGGGPPAPPEAGPPFQGIPGVDLGGLDRSRAARSLESFVALALRKGARVVKVRGLDHEPAHRAAEKWADLYRGTWTSQHLEEGRTDAWIVHFDRPCLDPSCARDLSEEILPGALVLIPRPDPEEGPRPQGGPSSDPT